MLRAASAACLALLLAPGFARAEGPVGPGGREGSPEEEIQRLAVRISKALKENEEALAKLARGEEGDPKKVDIALPPQGEPKQPPPDRPPPEGGGT